MQKLPTPLKIQKQSDAEMRIDWSSGETTVLPFKTIRFFCKCAECVDEWTRKRKLKIENIREDIKPVRVEPVGRYAIQIDWNDGHRTGIYSFDLLYEMTKGLKWENSQTNNL